MTAYLVGWTKPRDIFPTFTRHDDKREAEAAHALHLLIDPEATIAALDSTEEKSK